MTTRERFEKWCRWSLNTGFLTDDDAYELWLASRKAAAEEVRENRDCCEPCREAIADRMEREE